MNRSRPLKSGLMLVLGMLVLSSVVSAAEKKSDWKPLMDGKTLAGWHKVGDGDWTVEDGAFVGRANKTKLYGLLVSDKTFKDFTVRFKFKCLTGDSGFYIRTIMKDPDQAHGLQVQVGLAGSGAGGLYESYGRAWVSKPDEALVKKAFKHDEWNEMEILADGGHIVTWLNGTQIAESQDDPVLDAGHLVMQMHSGNKLLVMFKDIQVVDLDKK